MSKVKRNLLTAGICVLIAFVCLFGFIMLQNMCSELFIRWGWAERTSVNLFAKGFWYAFFTAALLPPIYEELIFRFLLCKGGKLAKMPDWLVIGLSAVIFMLYHRSWSQTAYQLIMGIFFAWIFLKTNNIGWTMLIHFINNAFVVTYTYFVAPSVFPLNAGTIVGALVTAAATIAIVTLLIVKGIPHAERA